MFYITSYDRFGRRYTSKKTTTPSTTIQIKFTDLSFWNKRELTGEETQYTTFRIPKASGGYREINAPSEQLKARQKEIVRFMQEHLKILESPWTYAYTKNKSAIDALRKHQENNSKWFLKLDIKNFFPSCTKTVVKEQLAKIYPICSCHPFYKTNIFDLLDKYAYHKESLPQGSASSPYLSNLVMAPIDYEIHQLLKEAKTFKKQKYVYTRYADDLLISAKNSFEWKEIEKLIQEILSPHFELKTEKTRYGSSAGRNWNLGAMLNKNNQITIGYKAKELWKRKMMEIIIRHNNNENIPKEEKQHLQGMLSYYKSIELDYFNYLNKHYNQKYKTNFELILKIN